MKSGKESRVLRFETVFEKEAATVFLFTHLKRTRTMHTLAADGRLSSLLVLLLLANAVTAQSNPARLSAASRTLPSSTPPSETSSETSSLIIESVRPASAQTTRVQNYGLTRRDLSTLLEVLPEIDSWAACRAQPAEVRHQRYREEIRLVGVSPKFDRGANFDMTAGRFLEQEDFRRRQNTCVIHETLAHKLAPNKDPVGTRIQVGDQYFSVVGVFKLHTETNAQKSLTVSPQDILIPLSTMHTKLGDVVIERRQGSFEVSEYELSAVQLKRQQNVGTQDFIELVTHILKKNHPDNDYRFLLPE